MFRIVLAMSIAMFVASIILATLQRYVASLFSLLSGLALLSFLTEHRRTEEAR